MYITDLKDKHKGQTAWIVGLGPSLQYLTGGHIGSGIIIAMNESIYKVQSLKISNKIYSLQKHGCGVKTPHDACKVDMFRPKAGTPVLIHEPEGAECLRDYPDRYLFNNSLELKLKPNELSSITAVRIAQFMGCDKIRFVCHDNSVNNNFTRLQPKETGGHTVIVKWNYDVKSMGLKAFLAENNIDAKFITPGYQAMSSKNKLKLIIATPFYSMSGYSPYIVSMFRSLSYCHKQDIWPEYWDLSGDSYVDRARNSICAKFLESDATDLLFVDSDMAWQEDAIIKILQSPWEITGAAYPVKNDWEEYGVVINTNEDKTPSVDQNTGLISAEWIPAGFMRIKKEALERFANAYSSDYYYDPSACPDNPGRRYINFFRCIVEKEHRYGEDVEFCRRWKAIGGKLWVEPRITFKHCGMTAWTGNYHEFLLRQPRPK